MEDSELDLRRIRELCREQGIPVNRQAAMSGVKQSALDSIARVPLFGEFIDFSLKKVSFSGKIN